MLVHPRRAVATLFAIGGLFWSQAAWGVPPLQLTFHADDNPGASIAYDDATATTLLQGSSTATLTAYGLNSAWDANAPQPPAAVLAITLDPDTIRESIDPNVLTVSHNGQQVTPAWTYGTPPVAAAGGDVSSEGMFPAWYAEVEIGFDDPAWLIQDVHTGLTHKLASGYAEQITIELLGAAVGMHFDLYTHAYDSQGNLLAGEMYAYAPYDYDAGIPGVPEPATWLMFAMGGWLVVRLARRHAAA